MVELCMIVLAVSEVVAALALAVIASQLHWVIVYLNAVNPSDQSTPHQPK
jgi:hypothetical protein